MTAPMSGQRIAEIEAHVAAVPPPPWRWEGQGFGGAALFAPDTCILTIDHEGGEYCETDLLFRGDTRMYTGAELATKQDADGFSDLDSPVARWFENAPGYVTEMAAEIRRLRTPLRDERLAEIETRLRKACPGEWYIDPDGDLGKHTLASTYRGYTLIGAFDVGEPDSDQPNPEVVFVEHATTDIAALITEVRRLRAELAAREAPITAAESGALHDWYAEINEEA